MTVFRDDAVGFFADFLAAEGGLYEERNGLVTCLVPAELGRALDVPEAVTVTADPDASREEDAMLLVPGHPVIDAAADRVLGAADVGVCHVGAPAGAPPSVQSLLARVRGVVAVDHGRVDAAPEAPASVRLAVLRAGAVVIYDVTPDDRFHERAEVWVDATTGLALHPDLAAVGAAAVAADGPRAGSRPDGRRVLPYDQTTAVAAAHRLLEQRAGERLAELARQRRARLARDEEAARAEAYYRDALASLDSRRASATPERRMLLDAQAEAVRAEQARRLREIQDKFESRYQLRPFRLQVVTLPAVTLPLVVRRGPRSWPLTVTWLTGPGRPLPLRCPHCAEPAPLVAAKDLLGCRSCLPRASLAPVAAVPSSGPSSTSAARPSPHHPVEPVVLAAPAAPVAPVAPAAPKFKRKAPAPTPSHPVARRGPRPVDMTCAGERLARELCRSLLSGRRWPRRDLAPGSPLEALVRAYGHRGLRLALDLPEGLTLDDIAVVTLPAARGRAEVTTGLLTVRGIRLPFTLRWRREGSRSLPGELMPFATHSHALVAARTLPPCADLAVGPPPCQLDPVARELWQLVGPDGLPVLARSLAVWWSAQGEPDAVSLAPGDAAALVAEAVRHWPRANVFVDILGEPDWWAR